MFNIMESGILVKAFALLETLADAPGGKGLADLAATNALAKPTAHRVLQCLIGAGYVEKSEVSAYRLTGKLRSLVLGVDDRALTAAGEAPLKALHGKTGETVNLGVLRGDRIIYLMTIESTHPLRRVVQANDTDPFHCTALGRAIVSHLPASQQALMLKRSSPAKRTPETVTDRQQLQSILTTARRDGFSIERNQTDLGVTCIGFPVFQADTVVAAVSLSAPSVRFDAVTQKRWMSLVQSAAQAINTSLGKTKGHSA